MPTACPHETRHGVTVCLHCRHAALAEARSRRNSLLSKIGLAVLGVGAVVAIGIAGAGALEGRTSPARALVTPGAPPKATRPVVAVESAAEIAPAATPAAPSTATLVSNPSSSPAVVTPAVVTPAVATVPSAAPTPAPAPAAGANRTELGEGLYALRAGDTVTVHFDTPLTRTRFPEKFERIVRSTLPRVMGAASPAASALATVPSGQLAVAGDLLTELPTRGIQLPLDAGRVLTLWPETRPGDDGPLVVRYRAVIR